MLYAIKESDNKIVVTRETGFQQETTYEITPTTYTITGMSPLVGTGGFDRTGEMWRQANDYANQPQPIIEDDDYYAYIEGLPLEYTSKLTFNQIRAIKGWMEMRRAGTAMEKAEYALANMRVVERVIYNQRREEVDIHILDDGRTLWVGTSNIFEHPKNLVDYNVPIGMKHRTYA
ncbi:hypothetical protein [Caldilinea sp.]|uniref:hypothetical protein n=1 Tax=Caldilinea sp. TaxID=2293560 RepID=UPI002D0A4178|nr:hypothetical protein [Caldilinea sp.]